MFEGCHLQRVLDTSIRDMFAQTRTLLAQSLLRQLCIEVHVKAWGGIERIYWRISNVLCQGCLCAVAGKRLHVVAGLTEARLGCDLLISRREIAEFESDGYRLSAR